MTSCTSFKPDNIAIGKGGTYTFQKGFTKEKRTGLINRKSGSLTNNCILPSLQSREIVFMGFCAVCSISKVNSCIKQLKNLCKNY
jgi:hypothetical protein